MTPTEAIIGLVLGAGGFVVSLIIGIGWAVSQRRRRGRADDEEDTTRFGD